jgi:hypothetical protein
VWSCTVLSRMHPTVKQKGYCLAVHTLGTILVSLQGSSVIGDRNDIPSHPIPSLSPSCTQGHARENRLFDRDLFLDRSLGMRPPNTVSDQGRRTGELKSQAFLELAWGTGLWCYVNEKTIYFG